MGTTDQQITIKFHDIFIPDGLNGRSDLPAIESLAESMKQNGQITPVIVRKAPEGSEKPWVLISGRRRMAAYAYNKWTMREILAVVREYSAADVLGPIVDNWIENGEREQVDTLDNAERIHQLLTGTYFVFPGQEAKPLTPEAIGQRFGMTPRSVQKLAKVFRDIDPDVARAARKAGAPQWLVIKLSQLQGEGPTKADKEEKRAKLQMGLLDEWVEHKKMLEASGRQRAPKDAKKSKKKKRAAEEESEWGAINPALPIDKKERTVEHYFALLNKKVSATKDEKQALLATGARDMIRLLSGEVTRLSFVTEADWAELLPPEVAEEEEGTEEDEAAE